MSDPQDITVDVAMDVQIGIIEIQMPGITSYSDGSSQPTNPGGGGGGGGGTQTAYPFTASTTWHIVHNLGRYPVPLCMGSDNVPFEGEVTHFDINVLSIAFSTPTTGTAYLI